MPPSQPRKGRVPTAYRAILREVKKGKRGRDIHALLKDARGLPDPYFQALALFNLSADPRLGPKEARAAAKDAFDAVRRVTQVWRKGEALAEIARRTPRWRGGSGERDLDATQDGFHAEVARIVGLMPLGHGLSQAAQEIAPRLPPRHLVPLLEQALANQGFEQDDARAVLRAWVRNTRGRPDPKVARDVVARLRGVDDPWLRSRLLGYLHLQVKKAGARLPDVDAFRDAVRAAEAVDDVSARVEALRYLGHVVADQGGELWTVRGTVDALPGPVERARVLATLGGSADKAGLRDTAREWLLEGVDAAAAVDDVVARVAVTTNLAEGLARADLTAPAEDAFRRAVTDTAEIEDETKRSRALGKLAAAVKRTRVDVDVPDAPERATPAPEARTESPAAPAAAPGTTGKAVLALYDAYEGALKPVHYRAVARAAPLCAAFDLDLALVGFPSEDVDAIVDGTIRETNVGKGGRLLKDLAANGRVILLHGTADAPPGDWSPAGLPVATTSHPDPAKATDLAAAVRAARAPDGPGRVCLVMGLGRHGLPKSLLERVPFHLELTDRNVPMETATAMGVIAERLRAFHAQDA